MPKKSIHLIYVSGEFGVDGRLLPRRLCRILIYRNRARRLARISGYNDWFDFSNSTVKIDNFRYRGYGYLVYIKPGTSFVYEPDQNEYDNDTAGDYWRVEKILEAENYADDAETKEYSDNLALDADHPWFYPYTRTMLMPGYSIYLDEVITFRAILQDDVTFADGTTDKFIEEREEVAVILPETLPGGCN